MDNKTIKRALRYMRRVHANVDKEKLYEHLDIFVSRCKASSVEGPLVLIYTDLTDGDIVSWTAVSPEHGEYRSVVRSRLDQGYLPVGLVDLKQRKAAMLTYSVGSAVERGDYRCFVDAELNTVGAAADGSLPPELGWLDPPKTN